MVIDIDIRISDNKGKLLHRLEKHFDRLADTDDKFSLNVDLCKSFEQFLSEYMTNSGRIIRNKLIMRKMNPSETNIDRETEIEYNIKIGNNHVFYGTFPFDKLVQVPTSMVNAIEKYEANFYEESIEQD